MRFFFLIISLIIFLTTYSYCDIDFRNNGNNTIIYQSYEEDSSKSETIVKLSIGLYNDIQSKINCEWFEGIWYYEYDGSDWQDIEHEYDSGFKNISSIGNNITYDLSCEYRYYFYDFFAFGGGVDIPLQQFETLGSEVYVINPYLSFKLKNFLRDFDKLNNFYVLLNLGTLVPFGHFKGLDSLELGFDIGIGYEYKNFIFELSYNKYSVALSDFWYYKYEGYTRYTDANHYYDYNSYEYGLGENRNLDISRFRISVGYKF